MDATSSAELILVTKDFISSVSENYSGLTSAIYWVVGTLILISTGLVGANLFWSFYYSDKKINERVDETVKLVKSELEEKLELKFEEAKSTLIAEFETKNRETLEKFDNKVLFIEGDLARNYAIHSDSTQTKINWFFQSLKCYIDGKKESGIGLVTAALVQIFEKNDWITKLDDAEDMNWQNYEKQAQRIPEILHFEKNKILKAVKRGKNLKS